MTAPQTLAELVAQIRDLSAKASPAPWMWGNANIPANVELMIFIRNHADLIADVLDDMHTALDRIAYGEAHIGNDENGNMFGPLDRVMCWKCAQDALSGIAERLREGET